MPMDGEKAMIGFVNNSHNYNVTRSWQKINSIEIEAQPQLPRLHSYINVIVTTFPPCRPHTIIDLAF